MGYYPETDEEFYAMVELKRKEIGSFDIPELEKEKLYLIVDETIERYEEGKKYNLAESFGQLGDSLVKLMTNIYKLGEDIQSLVPTLNRTKINLQIANYKVKGSKKTLNRILNEERKLGAKLTAQLIIKNMRESNQNN